MKNIPIFLFHRVGLSKSKWGLAMDPHLFEKTIQYLNKHFHILLLEDYFLGVEIPDSKRPIACVNFDDGFKDNIEYAAPILRKYNCPASFYLVTNSIDTGTPTWVHLYKQAMEETCLSKLELESEHLGSKKIDIVFTSRKEKDIFSNNLFEKLKSMPFKDQQDVLSQIRKSFYDVEIPENIMLNWPEINELKNQGFSIGSHTKNHLYLTFQENDQSISDELTESAKRIEQMTGALPSSISYPAGDNDSRVVKLAEQAGYSIGLTVTQERYQKGTNNLMTIPRIDLYADANWTKTYLRINGVLQLIKNALIKVDL